MGVPIKYYIALMALIGMMLSSGCSVDRFLKSVDMEPANGSNPLTMKQEEQLFDKFYHIVAQSGKIRKGERGLPALQQLPRDAYGRVNWTTAVMEGLLAPKGAIATEEVEETPLNLNIFIEAKVPMMANVVFPHSIHTYWLSCDNCHPKIFISEAGANPITMDEIFGGEWCGRCHGRVAFDLWPEANCRRCHMVPKKMSGRHENF